MTSPYDLSGRKGLAHQMTDLDRINVLRERIDRLSEMVLALEEIASERASGVAEHALERRRAQLEQMELEAWAAIGRRVVEGMGEGRGVLVLGTGRGPASEQVVLI